MNTVHKGKKRIASKQLESSSLIEESKIIPKKKLSEEPPSQSKESPIISQPQQLEAISASLNDFHTVKVMNPQIMAIPIEPMELTEKPLLTKEYILSIMKDINERNYRKPAFRKCGTHAGIAYYIQLSKKESPATSICKNNQGEISDYSLNELHKSDSQKQNEQDKEM